MWTLNGPTGGFPRNREAGSPYHDCFAATYWLEHATIAQVLREMIGCEDAWVRAALSDIDTPWQRPTVWWLGHALLEKQGLGNFPVVCGILRNQNKFRAFLFGIVIDDDGNKLTTACNTLGSTESASFDECLSNFRKAVPNFEGAGTGNPWNGDNPCTWTANKGLEL